MGIHSGISVGEDGGAHQAIEDIALMRNLPDMTVIYPADDMAVLASMYHKGPVYLRLSRVPSPAIHNEDYKFEIEKGQILKVRTDAAIILQV